MNDKVKSNIPDLPNRVSEPLLRLIRQLDPKKPLPPTSIAAVEAYKRKFLRHLQQELSAASEIISSALIADGSSQAAAHAEVDRFANEVACVVRSFGLDAVTKAAIAEEISQSQSGLELITPMQESGEA